MTQPIMIGTMEGKQFIIIKADCKITEENKEEFSSNELGSKVEVLIGLYEMAGSSWESNIGNLTYPNGFHYFIYKDGSFCDAGQMFNFINLQSLIKNGENSIRNGEGGDAKYITWIIPSE